MKLLVIFLLILPVLILAYMLRSALAAQELREGEPAPAFSTDMVVGEQVRAVKLADFAGRKVVLYFYPKDDTPGCTREACAFRDGFARYERAGIQVLGCSIDTAESHKAFIKKYNLPFPLLLDPDKKIATAYGAANGIPILGLDRRMTFVIDEKGRIAKIYPHVDPAAHATEIIQALGPLPVVTARPTLVPTPVPREKEPEDE